MRSYQCCEIRDNKISGQMKMINEQLIYKIHPASAEVPKGKCTSYGKFTSL